MGDPTATPRLKHILDEMFPAVIAEALRADDYDVIAVQEDRELRELTDPELFATAQQLERALVTEKCEGFHSD
jgi:predicted nuclease of predicted toxin-antitoxin system